MNDLRTCIVCNNSGTGDPRDWHHYRHQFKSAGSGGGVQPKSDEDSSGGKPADVSMPFDPVLRQALIDAGVITPEQLRDAEFKIRAVTQGFMGAFNEVHGGDSDDGTVAGTRGG